MTSSQIYRASGLALLIGAVVSIISSVLDGALFPSNDPASAMNPLNVALSTLGVVGTVCALLGLPGMYARSARQGGTLWLAGCVLVAITGMLFGIFMGLMGALVFPALAAGAPALFSQGPPPSFLALFVVASLCNVLGALGMGIPMLTKRLYARWCGYLMLLAAVLAAVSFFVQGPGDSAIGTVLNIISPLPLFIVLGWAGYELWSSGASAVVERGAQAAAQPA
jgi:hypothetical protein